MFQRLAAIGPLFVIGVIVISQQAGAALGGNESTIESDRVAVKAQSKAMTSHAKFIVHSMEVAGTTINEYLDENGTVFAVSWKGLARPDLETLLGDHYNEYLQAKSQKPRDPGRAPLHIETSKLVVRHAGHMRAVSGQAYLTDQVPAGVNIEDLK